MLSRQTAHWRFASTMYKFRMWTYLQTYYFEYPHEGMQVQSTEATEVAG